MRGIAPPQGTPSASPLNNESTPSGENAAEILAHKSSRLNDQQSGQSDEQQLNIYLEDILGC